MNNWNEIDSYSPRNLPDEPTGEVKCKTSLRIFSNRVGNELFTSLRKQASEELTEQSDLDRLTAMLGAALIAVAEVLRVQIEPGSDVGKLVDFSSCWLRVLLEPVRDKGKTS